ncbi:hypothetical protein [Streptomyces apocyni]|uniref:hypothetical protein n=1 Tax=Streptomyces apocyni TaxID=2654677 RepID=UPI0018D1D54C|nr:hypothetical protein [Streptomyces apocyni]
MLGGAGILLAASPAQAAEVSYATECVPPPISGLPPVQGTTTVDITAPAEAKVGDEVEVVWKTVKAASSNPDVLDLDADTVKPTGVLKLAGAQTEDLAMEGERANPPIPKNSPMVLSDMKATLTLTAAGEVTLTPDTYEINVSKPISTDTKCAPTEEVDVAATINVTEDGGSSGGGASGGDTGGDTGGTGGDTGGTGGDTGGSTGGDSGGDTGGTGGTGGDDTGGTTGGGDGGDETDFPGKEVTVAFACESPGPDSIESAVTINAKKKDGSYDLTVATADGVMDSPAPLPANALTPSMDVTIGGADKGTVKVTGPPNKEPLEQGKPVNLPDMTGTYTPGAAGKATLAPGTLTIKVSLGGQDITIPCTVKGEAPVSLELDVEDEGGVTGGTSNGGTTSGGSDGGSTGSTGSTGSSGGTAGGPGSTGGSSGTGGGLAETGASDNGALRALALVAGTVILLGGAVFTFMPRRRLR